MPAPMNPVAPLVTAPKSSIFSAPLKAKQEATMALRKKNQRESFVRLLVAVVALGVYSTLFFYPQFKTYLAFGSQLAKTESEISQYDSKLADLQKTRDLHKAAYDEQYKVEQSIINTVFPLTTDKLTIIRLLENFSTNLNATYPPFEFNSISFQNPVKKAGYTVLPFTTTIQTSRANFDRFLELVKLSGNADPKAADHIRLMDISNITIRYRGTDAEGKDMGVDFTVKMNAYSR